MERKTSRRGAAKVSRQYLRSMRRVLLSKALRKREKRETAAARRELVAGTSPAERAFPSEETMDGRSDSHLAGKSEAAAAARASESCDWMSGGAVSRSWRMCVLMRRSRWAGGGPRRRRRRRAWASGGGGGS